MGAIKIESPAWAERSHRAARRHRGIVWLVIALLFDACA